ncbi:MAG: NAD(P)H-binding protein [Chloroflexi bacterium]|nr:NAD(P)H-binding protein [Chloroflexota bacterium]
MAEANQTLSVLVTGGAEGAGLATVRALLKRGHKVAATACDAEGALALRMAGALPVFPDLGRASEILSTLQMTKAQALVHAGPQFYGGAPHNGDQFADNADQLRAFTAALVAAARHKIERMISLSFAYLYDSARGAAKEGDPDTHEGAYAPMLAAETLVRESGLSGFIIRSGYIYGGASAETAALADSIKRSRRLPAGTQPASWIHEDDLAAAIVALLESEDLRAGVETINVAAESRSRPDEFCVALSQALGLAAPGFAKAGFLASLREKSLRDKLLGREVTVDSSAIRERFGWTPKHDSIESGLEATALVWRMKDAVAAEDFYEIYDDKAAAAIASFAYDAALPEPVEAAPEPKAEPAVAATEPAPVKAEAPPPSAGPTPWNEDEAKREERRRKALERKAKRAAQRAGG